MNAPITTGGAIETVDSVVVGAGVVGLACARALALAGYEVIVVEAASGIGTGVSSRNSEVIHAGLYYPAGSLKARHCVRGKAMLYAYCAERGVPARACGKLVVATHNGQIATLLDLQSRGGANGVHDLQMLSGEEARRREPALRAVAALWSPSSGIVDSHGLMLSLQGDLERSGGVVAFQTRVRSFARHGASIDVITEPSSSGPGPGEPMTLRARRVVNAAGLFAVGLARSAIDLQPRPQTRPGFDWPHAHFARGRYFSLSSQSPFRHLIYPVPEPGGLGVHLTLDLAGQARFGPDVQWMPEAQDAGAATIDRFDYAVDEALRDRFATEIQHYWPDLPAASLAPAYSGIRPKLSGPGETAADFAILGPAEHGIGGLVHLLGIESPGLTSALSIADDVVERLSSADTR